MSTSDASGTSRPSRFKHLGLLVLGPLLGGLCGAVTAYAVSTHEARVARLGWRVAAYESFITHSWPCTPRGRQELVDQRRRVQLVSLHAGPQVRALLQQYDDALRVLFIKLYFPESAVPDGAPVEEAKQRLEGFCAKLKKAMREELDGS